MHNKIYEFSKGAGNTQRDNNVSHITLNPTVHNHTKHIAQVP